MLWGAPLNLFGAFSGELESTHTIVVRHDSESILILGFWCILYLQVLTLLDLMGLKVYQENFSSEQVSGEILSECDEEVLKVDLGIASKLHRMRLLKVISGNTL